jgi:hypothetical protein
MIENKNSYFTLDVKIQDDDQSDVKYKEELENKIDLVFSALGTSYNQTYQFRKTDRKRIIYFFRTEKRKRRGQVVKFCDAYLPDDLVYKASAITKSYLDLSLVKLENDNNFVRVEEPCTFDDYNGEDLAIFENEKNWFPWQRDVYKMIFHPDGTFREAHQRHILSIIDVDGNSGKSSFFKYLLFKNPLGIGRLTYGTASQLRASSVNAGPKKLYLIDLARTKSKNDSEECLLSAIEDIKSGLIVQNMFGSSKHLLMQPPHILISSNYRLKYSLLSKDRWQIFKIGDNKKLGKLNQVIEEQKRQELIKKS